MRRIIIAIITLSLSAVSLAQSPSITGSKVIPYNTKKILENSTNGSLVHVVFSEPQKLDITVDEFLNELLETSLEVNFEELRVWEDKIGFTHKRYQPYIMGVPVVQQQVIVHFKNGLVHSVNSNLNVPGSQISATPSLSPSDAIESARAYIEGDVFYNTLENAPDPLVVFYLFEESFYLAYECDVYSVKPLKREYVYVNAANGNVINGISRLHSTDSEGIAQTRYSGDRDIVTDSLEPGTFRLNDYTRGDGIVTYDMNSSTFYPSATEITDGDNLWEYDDHEADAALDGHWGTEMSYDYFLHEHGRNSFDDEGALVEVYVDFDFNYSNAFWNGEALTFGSGQGADNPLTTVDIVGHELAHGVTEYSAGLIYAYESGALNESFSDIFGVAIDFHARGEDVANYEVGEESIFPPIRSMADPKAYGSPDTYQGELWLTGPFDNGGVHFNSGVQNHWFYLLCEGGAGTNDNGDNYSINSIGLEAAEQIAYRNLVAYLTPSSEYNEARYFSIQAALDLYGECSEEVIAVTNAWHAVGVGDPFDDAVLASFTPSSLFSCQLPASIQFNNQSTNGASFLWDFGDGNSSSEESPIHEYLEADEYIVQLISYGDELCGSSDTIVFSEPIVITNSDGPIAADCQPGSQNENNSTGITEFQFADISNSSGGSSEGYSDFTCETNSAIVEGQAYSLSVTTLSEEFVQVWLDLNNNGSFESDELIFASETNNFLNTSEIIIPEAEAYATPLRLRVRSSNSDGGGACTEPTFGQVEDYRITITENTSAPEANFTSSGQFIQQTDFVDFTDISLNLPDNWYWEFPGGMPSNSTLQNPSIQYSELGTYDVQLIVNNEYGADTLILEDYIEVVSTVEMCSVSETGAVSGQLFDSGGPLGSYSNGENCSLLISPGCALSITLSFNSFGLENCCDYFRVYDGPNSSSPLLLNVNGSSLPQDVTASSGEMFVTFTSDGSVTSSGWDAEWTSETPASSPSAEFSLDISDNIPVNWPIQFTDQTTEYPVSWLWSFGDGQTSLEQNPQHAFESPGTYEVSLIAFNCFSSDTTVQTITVEETPELTITPADTLLIEIECGANGQGVFNVQNTGDGILYFEPGLATTVVETPEILTLITYTDYFEEYENTIEALEIFSDDFVITESQAQNSAQLLSDLENKNILLIPEQESVPFNFFENLQGAFLSFLEDGGNIVFCGSQVVNMPEVAVFEYWDANLYDLEAINPDHPLTEGIGNSMLGSNATYAYDISADPEILPIYNPVVLSGDDFSTVFTKSILNGNLYYVGFDFFAYNDDVTRILSNAIELASTANLPGWIESVDLDGAIALPGGENQEVTVVTDASELLAGEYYYNFPFSTNVDGLESFEYVIHLSVSGATNIGFSEDNLNYEPLIPGFTSTDTLILYNESCETLELELTNTEPSWQLDQTVFSINGYESDTLLVTFDPVAPGEYLNDVIVSGNLEDTLFTLSGLALDIPELTLTPQDTLHIQIPCSSQLDTAFAIANTGDGILEATLASAFGGPANELNILAYTNGTDDNQEYANTISILEESDLDYQLAESSAFTSTQLLADLEDQDILLIPELENATLSVLQAIDDAIVEFTSNGGILISCGNEYANLWTPFEAFTNLADFSSGTLTLDLPEHPILNEVTEPFFIPNLIYGFNTSDDISESIVASVNNYASICDFEFGSGRAIYLGFDYFGSNENADLALINSVEYASTFALAGWLEILTETGQFNLGPGQSELIEIAVNSNNLVAGDYYQTLLLESNDPSNTSVEYVIQLEVIGQPDMLVGTEFLSDDSLMIGDISLDTLIIANSGCDILELELNLESEHFDVLSSNLTIQPFSTDSVLIQFSPQEFGDHTAELLLESNGGDSTVVLNGFGLYAPTMIVNPDVLNLEPETCADSILVEFTILNQGLGELDFEVLPIASNDPPLEDVLQIFGEEHSDLVSDVNDIFLFNGGETGSSINDGGGDMYDGGNELNTNFTTFIPYTTSQIVQSNFFGEETSYFTAKEPGIFLMAADLNGVTEFSVTGNLGADGAGVKLGYTLEFSNGINQYTGYVTSTINTNDPTINHLIITRSSPEIGHSFLTFTASENHSVSDLSSANRIYYILFATQPSASVSQTEMESVFHKFISTLNPGIGNSEGVIGSLPGETEEVIQLYISTSLLEEGDYQEVVYIESNDPLNPVDSVVVNFDIPANPCAGFEYSLFTDCSGGVEFQDFSSNIPSSWNWDFGDGSSSNDQNPTHFYSDPGNYEVQLEVCSGSICDVHTASIQVFNTGGPVVMDCPATVQAPSPNITITQMEFAGNGNISTGNSTGYEDFTCDEPFEVYAGQTYDLTVISDYFGGLSVQAWVDFDGGGFFSTQERLVEIGTTFNNNITIPVTIPNDAVLGDVLRFRIAVDDDFYDISFGCDELVNGEIEDYSLVVIENTQVPDAAFTIAAVDSCQGLYQFLDQSSGVPTSWVWSFADGSSSNEQNPYRQFDLNSLETIQLAVSNENGTSSVSGFLSTPGSGLEELLLPQTAVAGLPVTISVEDQGVVSYQWEWGDGNTDETSVPVATHTYAQFGSYGIVVSTTDPVCENVLAAALDVEQNLSTGSLDGPGSLRIYPNPSSGIFTLESDKEIESIRIFNSLGESVHISLEQKSSTNYLVSLEAFSSGLYLVEVDLGKKGVIKRRIVIGK